MEVEDETFVLKDSPPELIAAAGVAPKGRMYDKEFSEQPGGVRIDEVVYGMKCASLAITDDEEDTLEKIGKSNPWHIEALTAITGSKEEAHKPLSKILPDHMGLNCDKIISISGFTKGGHPLDTQGYIAHNDEIIVLAYRCTTTAFDWLTNLNTTSSEWELEEDLKQGYSGFLSGLEGLCCVKGEYKPRVHTGFYNNFLASAPFIQQHIDPLLKPDQPPRKLYVVGHSLGAGIASMAACYFLLEFDWTKLPHKLVALTAGSPRSCQGSMKTRIDEVMKKLRPLDKAVMVRLVRDRDVVPNLPPAFFGFKHLDKLVYITADGDILINPKLDDEHVIEDDEMKDLMSNNPIGLAQKQEEENDDEDDEFQSKYDRLVAKIPRPFRDHMPDFYLEPLIKLFEKESGVTSEVGLDDNQELNSSPKANDKVEEESDVNVDDQTVETVESDSKAEDEQNESGINGEDEEDVANKKEDGQKMSSKKKSFVRRMFSRKKKVDAES